MWWHVSGAYTRGGHSEQAEAASCAGQGHAVVHYKLTYQQVLAETVCKAMTGRASGEFSIEFAAAISSADGGTSSADHTRGMLSK